MESEIITDTVSSDVFACLFDGDVFAGLSYDDDDLTLIVEPLASLRSDHIALMGVERGDRLMEIGGRSRQLGEELLGPALIVEMDSDDLGWDCRCEMLHLTDCETSPIRCNERISIALDQKRLAIDIDSTELSHERGPDPSE
jgi:hypothetical protein